MPVSLAAPELPAELAAPVEQLVKLFYRVHHRFGPGFPRETYRNALIVELGEMGLAWAREMQIELFYRGRPVGSTEADLALGRSVLVSIEAARFLQADRADRLTRFVRASGWRAGVLLNFGSVAEYWWYHRDGPT